MAGEHAEGRTLVCPWWDDGRGGRYLVPGCHARVENPDIEVCHCLTIEQQLQAAHRQNAAAGRALRGQQAWHDAIVRAVYDHSDGIAIMKAAANLSEHGSGRGVAP
ncbi:hypothetical protein IM697_18620 [Streptomyces ferrugineus]|uniref:Uncharacterized protein n=1 Tax=Streptomyces ferrugineus TaxID=1413221 RepID=A0A7M2SV53_9ACTN|nr:hypothetical protein [Streptomyces ferrugineus]QOV40236.1 hypothetical protein IM697_18620 [Streptomyces ferrugineus]